MNLFRTRQFLAPLACGLLAILAGCDLSNTTDGQQAGGSDEIDTRIAVDRTGHPIAGARIALVKAGDSTGTALAISATGSDGSFPSFVVPDGFYSVLLRDPGDTLGRFVDSVKIVSRKAPTGRDTLLSLGSVRGVVRLGSGDSPTSVTVGLLGTDILANVKADGSFKIELVPGGLYTLGAITSLDGYGRLYKRIQLKDGQNLVLPDTLVLPFSGLPVPAGLRVLQDTATGNVKVTWNKVVHPDLLGYVLERVENGTTTFSRYLTDSTWTDSLGAYWEAMPLYGPWPSRDVAYRVRSRSLSGVLDTKSSALAITAKPPEWTKHVDSVKVTMTTDSVTGVSTLKWNAPKHPDVLGWNVTRSVNGLSDCSAQLVDGNWRDSACKGLDGVPVDSVVTDTSVARLLTFDNAQVRYELGVHRRLGSGESLWNMSRFQKSQKFVTWRDSLASDVTNDTRIESFGGWLLKRDWTYDSKRESFLSRDGLVWERIPQNFDEAIGFGDSLWTIALEKDSLHVQLSHRVENGKWTIRSVLLPSKAGWIQAFSLERGNVVIAYHPANRQMYSDTILTIMGDSSFVPTQIAGEGPNSKPMTNYGSFPLSERLRIDELQGSSLSLVSVVLDGKVIFSKSLYTARKVYGTLIGPVGVAGGIAVSYARGATIPKVVYFPLKGDAILMPFPDWVTGECSALVFNDEIWCFKSGHIWKGKLNLPK